MSRGSGRTGRFRPAAPNSSFEGRSCLPFPIRTTRIADAPVRPRPPAPRPSNGGGNVPGAVAAVIVAFAAGLLAGAAGIGLMGYRITAPKDAAPPPGRHVDVDAHAWRPRRHGGHARPAQGATRLAGRQAGRSDGQTAGGPAHRQQQADSGAAQRIGGREGVVRRRGQGETGQDPGRAEGPEGHDGEGGLSLAGRRRTGAAPHPARPPAPANPFTTEANAGHLKSLSERLEKGGNG